MQYIHAFTSPKSSVLLFHNHHLFYIIFVKFLKNML
nr:MAG TPA: hypothetical protein [Caudoviricetes sp.]DAU20685.1 MAG TPA: hypothetical protein [Caudoviricetes sp.]